jgi:DNA-binding transcriptional ArsR family regulator
LKSRLVVCIFNHMVEYNSEYLDKLFGALSDATRRAMVNRLSQGPATVTELAGPLDMSLNAVSKHLKVLERAGLVGREIQGRTHRLFLIPGPLSDAQQWIGFYRRFWEAGGLDSLLAWLVRTESRRGRERAARIL